MTEIRNNKYLYDFNSGETIGIKKGEVDNSNAEYSTQEIVYEGETYTILKKQAWRFTADYGKNYQKFTNNITNITFDDLIYNFAHGNLTISEFKTGLLETNLAHKGQVTDFKVIEKDGTYITTFKYQNVDYRISTTVEATASQTDNITYGAYANRTENVETITAGDRVKNLLNNLEENYPEVYNKYGDAILKAVGHWGTSSDTLYIESDWIDIEEHIFNDGVSEYNDEEKGAFHDLFVFASGLTATDSDAWHGKAKEWLSEKIGLDDKYGYTINIIDMFNFFLGENEEGINYIDRMAKNEPIYKGFKGWPGKLYELPNYNYFAKDGKYYTYQDEYRLELDGRYSRWHDEWQCYVYVSTRDTEALERAKKYVEDPNKQPLLVGVNQSDPLLQEILADIQFITLGEHTYNQTERSNYEKDHPDEEDRKTDYLYVMNGGECYGLVGIRVDNGYVPNFKECNNGGTVSIAHIDGHEGEWIDCGLNPYSKEREDYYVGIEDVPFENIIQMYSVDELNAGLPSYELEKGLLAKGVTDLTISRDGDWEIVKFSHEGKNYEFKRISYEVQSSYEWRAGLNEVKDLIKVSSAEELRTAMLTNPNGNIQLTCDIDMTGVKWTPIEEFSGTLYGGNYTISGLNIEANGEEVGFIKTLTGTVQDLNFKDSKVINNSTSTTSCTGIIAGKIVGGTVSGINIDGCEVSGGSYAGMIAGDTDHSVKAKPENRPYSSGDYRGGESVKEYNGGYYFVSFKTYREFDIFDCNIQNCSITGNYATGGMLGHSNATYADNCTVNNLEINGGVWVGGVIGSADNEFFRLESAVPDLSKDSIVNRLTNIKFDNITINNKYTGKATLGAGGFLGRTNTPDCIDLLGNNYFGKYYGKRPEAQNVTINNAYAGGEVFGWLCELDPETGHVTKNCDLPPQYDYFDEFDVGKAGTTKLEQLRPLADVLSLEDALLYIAKFAQENNLKEVPNMKGVYEDENGVRYWLWHTSNEYRHWNDIGKVTYHIATNDREHAIPAYHEETAWLGCEGDGGINDHAYSSTTYILTQLGAVDVVYTNNFNSKLPEGVSLNDSWLYTLGTEKGGTETIYYQTKDGKWHKYVGTWAGAVLHPENGRIFNNQMKSAFGSYTYEEYAAKYQGTKETLQYITEKDINGLVPPIPNYYIEDITYEEMLAELGGTTQPPHNTGYNGVIDKPIEEPTEKAPSILNDIPITGDPKTATYEDYLATLTLINFLNLSVNGSTYVPCLDKIFINDNSATYYKDFSIMGREDRPNETEERNYLDFTKENWEKYKDLIPLYDLDILRDKVFEKLFKYSTELTVEITGNGEPNDWQKALFKALNIEISSYSDPVINGRNTGCVVRPSYLSFEHKGSTYTLGFGGLSGIPDYSIGTKEQIEELKKYFKNEDHWEGFLYSYFTPITSINGNVETYMLTFNEYIAYFKSGWTPEGIDFLGIHWLNDFSESEIPDVDGSVRSMYWYEDMIKVLQNYDMDSRYEFRFKPYEITHVEKEQIEILKEYGMTDEILAWYLVDYDPNKSYQSCIFSFRKDPDVEFPKIYTFNDMLEFCQNNDIQKVFAELKAEKERIIAEREESPSKEHGGGSDFGDEEPTPPTTTPGAGEETTPPTTPGAGTEPSEPVVPETPDVPGSGAQTTLEKFNTLKDKFISGNIKIQDFLKELKQLPNCTVNFHGREIGYADIYSVRVIVDGTMYNLSTSIKAMQDGEGGITQEYWNAEDLAKYGFTDAEMKRFFFCAVSEGKEFKPLAYIKTSNWPKGKTLEDLAKYLGKQINTTPPTTPGSGTEPSELTTPPTTPGADEGADGVDTEPDVSEEAQDKAKNYWSTLKQAIAPEAKRLGYVLEDDGNYYFTRGNDKYLCIYNPWTDDFDEYLIASTKEDADVLVTENEDGDIQPTGNTLEGVFVKAHQTAEKESLIPTQDLGVYQRDNERYVWSITHDKFIKETEVTPEIKTWYQVFLEAMVMAEAMGLTPVLTTFCIYEDGNGKQYKYDIDEGKFVEHYV